MVRINEMRNVRRDNRVTILVDVIKPRGRGVTIYGKAELTPQTSPSADVISWTEKYMPRDKAEQYVKAMCKLTSLVKITVKPEGLASFDYNKDEAYARVIQEVWGE